MRTAFLEAQGFRLGDNEGRYWFWNIGVEAEYDLQWWPRAQSLMVATEDCSVRLLHKPSESQMLLLLAALTPKEGNDVEA